MTPRLLLGRYELLGLIGRGGMAEVWEARDNRLGRHVAVKTVNLAAAHDATVAERLRREAVAIAGLKHPDIVVVHDAGVDGDTAYVVMELVEGTDLAAVLRQGPLPPPEALRVAERVAGALAAAHAAGVVHRDIKPANVMLHGEDVTVLDFGIAAATQVAGASLTESGTVVGTAEYMAPEQAEGGDVSPARDVYALGCLTTAMLTGRPPFTGSHPLQILHQHTAALPPRLTVMGADVPAEVDALVGTMLAKQPSERPSAAAAGHALRELRQHLEPTTSAASAGTTAVLPATGTTLPLPRATTGRAASPTTPVPTAPAQRSTSTRGGRSSKLRWLAGGGVAAAVIAAMAVAAPLLTGGDPAGTEVPSPTTSAQQSAPTAAAEPRTAAPRTTAPPTRPAEEPARRQAELVTGSGMPALIASLEIDEKTREDLQKRWEKVTDALTEGKSDKASDRARDLGRRIEKLSGEGTLSRAEAEALQDELAATLDAGAHAPGQGGDNGGEEPKGGGDGERGGD